MSELVVYLFARNDNRALALRAALARLTSAPLSHFRVNIGGEIFERESAETGPALDLLLARVSATRAQVWDASVRLTRTFAGQSTWCSIYCVVAPSVPSGRFELTIPRSSLWTEAIEVPFGSARDESRSLAASRWAERVDGLMLQASGASSVESAEPLIPEMATLALDGAPHDPFAALALTHAAAATVVEDFAIGWLCAHTPVDMGALALCGRDTLRQRVEAAAERPFSRGASEATHGYDGSLSRRDVLRLLDVPAHDAIVAFEAAAGPLSDTTDAPRDLTDVNPRAAPGGRAAIVASKIPYRSRIRRLAGGGLLLGAGPMQRLWPVYRDAASLLLA